jgi:hypothetical protein
LPRAKLSTNFIGTLVFSLKCEDLSHAQIQVAVSEALPFLHTKCNPLLLIFLDRKLAGLCFVIPNHTSFANNHKRGVSMFFAIVFDKCIGTISSFLGVHGFRTQVEPTGVLHVGYLKRCLPDPKLPHIRFLEQIFKEFRWIGIDPNVEVAQTSPPSRVGQKPFMNDWMPVMVVGS